MKSSHLPVLVLGAALGFLALASSAQAPPKIPPPSGLTPAQTEERIKKLESRADAAEKAAASAALEKDYITRVQKQYESYYEKVLNTQMWTLGIMGLVLTAVFGLAARFSLDIFDRRVQSAVTEAQKDLTATMKIELENLRKENAAQIKELAGTLTAKMAQLEEDIRYRSGFQFQYVHGLAAAAAKESWHATRSFRAAVEIYKACKPRQLLTAIEGARPVRNIFIGLKEEYPDTFEQKAKEELAIPLYNDLEEELQIAALELPWLAPLADDRKQKPPTPPAPPPPPQS